MQDGRYHDAAEDNQASYWDHPIDHIEPEPEEVSTGWGPLQKLMAEMDATKRPGLLWDAMTVLLRIAKRDGLTVGDVAKRNRVTKGIMLARCVELQGKLGLVHGSREWVLLDRLLTCFHDTEKPAILLNCLAIALNIQYREGIAVGEVAKRHGLTRQAISKTCRQICQRIPIPPSALMRSPKERLNYAQSNRRNYLRVAGSED